ncbi:peptide deformylase [bacterium]|nr:peptide deformylase [bacterium]
MAILKVARLGHPVLRMKARPLSRSDIKGRDIQQFVDDMVETMRDYHGVGLAAPQVHAPYRIIVIEEQEASEDGTRPAVPLTALINPTLGPAGDQTAEDWEGCLSIPDLRGKVPRWASVSVRALDRQGREVAFEARDFFARVIQHEVDHLDGIVFLDRMKDMSTLTFLQEYARYWKPNDE